MVDRLVFSKTVRPPKRNAQHPGATAYGQTWSLGTHPRREFPRPRQTTPRNRPSLGSSFAKRSGNARAH
eukprot:1813484-Lingulodinium_polyedra.AAC.1